MNGQELSYDSVFTKMWCPKCKKKGLNAYNSEGFGTGVIQKVSEIEYLWCIYCRYKITSKDKKKRIK